MLSDAEIVRAVLAGDREAFASLVTRHERAAWATARCILRDDHAASDAAQEAFLQAYHRLSSLREPARFGFWLLRIVRREAVRLARQRSRHTTRSLAEVNRDPPDDMQPSARLSNDSEAVLAAVTRLPVHERLVLVLRYIDGLSVAEIASVLGRPVGTVTKQLSRAIARLKGNLREVLR
jgi:RNA polymerase sigma-70 factor (ECF subfamily)